MKKGMLLLLLVGCVFAHGQSLKEALFSGKLKNEPGTVVRKGDDLSSKMDTATRKAASDTVAKAKATSVTTDSSAKRLVVQGDSVVVSSPDKKNVAAASTDTAPSDTAAAGSTANAPEATAAPKDNNALWKVYVDTVAGSLKTEVLNSKKIKKGTYYVTVSYAIGTDGQVAIGDVFVSPENGFLQQQVKDRLNVDTPRLSPVLSSTGTPRKVTRKYNFTLTKE